MLNDHGIAFIGPKAEHIRTMGDKIEAKRTAKRLGIPCVPGSEGGVSDEADAKRIAAEIGYPVLIKAAAGGGGRGMKVARTEDDLAHALATARTEALAYGVEVTDGSAARAVVVDDPEPAGARFTLDVLRGDGPSTTVGARRLLLATGLVDVLPQPGEHQV